MPPIKAGELLKSEIHPDLRGTRLAYHLKEILNNYGSHDAELADLVRAGLKGRTTHNGTDVFTGIRDLLLKHGNPESTVTKLGSGKNTKTVNATSTSGIDPKGRERARELAVSYNWHRVGSGLKLDEAVRDYIDGIAKDHIKGKHLRAAAKLYTDPKTRNYEGFWNGLWDHLNKKGIGDNSVYGLNRKDVTQDKIENSMRRIAAGEGNREELALRSKQQIKSPAQVDKSPRTAATDYLHWLPSSRNLDNPTAWTSGKNGIKANPLASAEQFAKRLEEVIKYIAPVIERQNTPPRVDLHHQSENANGHQSSFMSHYMPIKGKSGWEWQGHDEGGLTEVEPHQVPFMYPNAIPAEHPWAQGIEHGQPLQEHHLNVLGLKNK